MPSKCNFLTESSLFILFVTESGHPNRQQLHLSFNLISQGNNTQYNWVEFQNSFPSLSNSILNFHSTWNSAVFSALLQTEKVNISAHTLFLLLQLSKRVRLHRFQNSLGKFTGKKETSQERSARPVCWFFLSLSLSFLFFSVLLLLFCYFFLCYF